MPKWYGLQGLIILLAGCTGSTVYSRGTVSLQVLSLNAQVTLLAGSSHFEEPWHQCKNDDST
jgi:hypothetical protein